ncbi:MAG: META domain-containing protein [Lysobacteraceae bacterium]
MTLPRVSRTLTLAAAVLALCACRGTPEPAAAPAAAPPEAAAAGSAAAPHGLEGTRWRVLSIDGHTPLPDTAPTIIFFEPGRIAGSGSCNRYNASYDHGEGYFRIGQAASTMMACEDAVMRQEQRFLDLMAQVERVYDTGTHLQLVTADGRQVYAERNGAD